MRLQGMAGQKNDLQIQTKSPGPIDGPGPGGSFSRPGLAIPCRVTRQQSPTPFHQAQMILSHSKEEEKPSLTHTRLHSRPCFRDAKRAQKSHALCGIFSRSRSALRFSHFGKPTTQPFSAGGNLASWGVILPRLVVLTADRTHQIGRFR